MSNAFSTFPYRARNHFRLHFHAAVYRIVHALHRMHPSDHRDLHRTVDQYPFLAEYLQEMLPLLPNDASWEELPGWWEREIEAWEATGTGHLPLAALTRGEGVSATKRLLLMVIGLVEEDSRFGTLFAGLQEPLAHRRPTLDLLGQMLSDGDSEPGEISAAGRALTASGLADVLNPDAPRSEWLLRPPPVLWDLIRGESPTGLAADWRLHERAHFEDLETLNLAPDLLGQIGRAVSLLGAGKARVLELRGITGAERLEVIGAVARRLGVGVAEVPVQGRGEAGPQDGAALRHLGPLCILGGYLPVLRYDLAPGETAIFPVLSCYRGPVGVIMGLEGGLGARVSPATIRLTLPPPREEQRLRYWRQAFGDHPVPDLNRIVERFHLPGGHIRRLARTAIAAAAVDGRERIALEDVRRAARTLNRQGLDTLATPVSADGGLEQLVVSDPVSAKLRELMQRCRYRERLPDHLGSGFDRRMGWGVRALFGGASGTGKTLAAKLLAAELGMDLYRVDLGAVVNKYIGETEKNLHRVLSKAEELDVILLLDEGEALMGGRTEVKSANDRYANLETDYLLQRLENYQGIILVTTNTARNIDSAFQRRMDVVVDFLPPEAPQRLRIWQLHLPDTHLLDYRSLEEIARRHALTGGQIRNAALYATLLSLDAGDGMVRPKHVEEALRNEYRKAGAVGPADRPPPRLREDYGDMQSFMGVFER